MVVTSKNQYKVYYGVFFKGEKTPEISAKVAIF
jgi:hypothetical protein